MERESQSIEYIGEAAVVLENEALRATVVPAWGGRVVSLYSKRAGLELLREPASAAAYHEAPLVYGVPVLFPPNRIEGGTFTFEGRTYEFERNEAGGLNHIHGLVQSRAWDVARAAEAEAVLVFDGRAHPDVMAQFPHPFRLEMTLRLRGATLDQTVKVSNESDASFPWGLGYHTTFRFPFGPASSPSGCTVTAPLKRRWELNGSLPTGRLVEDERCEALRRSMPFAGVAIDDLFIRDETLPNAVTLADRDAGVEVEYRADPEFLQWILHNGDGTGGYLCPEPYTCVTNAFNLDLPADVTGLLVLAPGESRELTCSIRVAAEERE
jgi:aldose 1-epimerase